MGRSSSLFIPPLRITSPTVQLVCEYVNWLTTIRIR
jgi:hypothetical protein